MVARRPLPKTDHVMRYVPKARQERDDDDVFLGLALGAFMLGANDRGGMSVTWIEWFGPFGTETKKQAAMAFRASLESKKLGATAVFATAKVESVLAAGEAFSKPLRVVYDPVPGNPAHAEIRHFDQDDLELLDFLAIGIFTDIDHVADLNLPKA